MNATINATLRVNLHCHSNVSDGVLSPGDVAELLARSGVRVAALTDHDSIDGVARFNTALAHQGIAAISGVELTVKDGGLVVHLLVYGFDAGSSQIKRAIDIARSKEGLPISEGLSLIRSAGARSFLAHPLTISSDVSVLEDRVRFYKSLGLDGIEAIYAPYSSEQILSLIELAGKCDMLVCAGSDYHGPDISGLADLAINMPLDLWRGFRSSIVEAPRQRPTVALAEDKTKEPDQVVALPRLKWKNFGLRIVLPTILAMLFFVVPLFSYVIPGFEEALLARKLEMIRELTLSAASLLEEYHQEVIKGRLNLADAQKSAMERIQFLRYGKEGKDYFWITDLYPRMVMHPYLPELNGTDLSNYQDKSGIRLFVSFVNLVKEQNEGYLEYYWQWKDDPRRVVPKQSYVRLFEPWGWVIGTGVYLDDVYQEISSIVYRVVRAMVVVALVIALLLFFVAQQSFRIEHKRLLAESALRDSHERYRTLVQASKEGSVLVIDGRGVFANQTFLEMSGYSESEWVLFELDELMEIDRYKGRFWEWVGDSLEKSLAPAEGILRRRDRSSRPISVSVERVNAGGKEGAVIILRDLSSYQGAASALLERDLLISSLQAYLLSLGEPISRFMRNLICVELKSSTRDAARLMSQFHQGAVLVKGVTGEYLGIVTDSDIRERVVARGLDADQPIYTIMSSPILSLAPSSQSYRALLLMRMEGVQHLAVREDQGKMVGLLNAHDLIQVESYPLAYLERTIREAARPEDVIEQRAQLPLIVKALVDSGARSRYISRAINGIADVMFEKLISLAIREQGPPPTTFAFLTLGSHGRGEPTLISDQDTALVYRLPEGVDEQSVQKYFLAIAEQSSQWLDAAGFSKCQGNIMASNSRWCQSLETWCGNFEKWIECAEPQSLLEFGNFFDFRCIYGSLPLVEELREFIYRSVQGKPAFFGYLAQEIVQYKIPLGFFGSLVSDREHSLDLKDAAAPLVHIARIYALKHSLAETNTFERLEHLANLGVVTKTDQDEAIQAYDYLQQMRLRRQAQLMSQGKAGDNTGKLDSLTHLEESALRQAFSQIGYLQKRIGLDFLGQ